jgi:hypothetical protein
MTAFLNTTRRTTMWIKLSSIRAFVGQMPRTDLTGEHSLESQHRYGFFWVAIQWQGANARNHE